jgi:hypothetical protein
VLLLMLGMALIVWCHAQHFGYFWAIFYSGILWSGYVRAVYGFPENLQSQKEIGQGKRLRGGMD